MRVPVLRTSRLTLRAWLPKDADAYARLAGDRETMRFVGIRRPLTRLESERDVERFVEHWRCHGFGHWAVEENASARFVGRTGLHCRDDWDPRPGAAEIGWILERGVWGQGYATEAGRVALRHAFTVWGLSQVISIADCEHMSSLRVMEKLGLVDRGTCEWRGHLVRWRAAEREAWLAADMR